MLGFRPKIPHSYLSLCTWTLETFRRGHHRQDSLDTGSYVSTHPSCGAPPFRKLQNFELRSRVCVCGEGTLLLSYAMGTESESLAKWSSPPMISFVLSLKAVHWSRSSPVLILHISSLPQVSPILCKKQMFTQAKAFRAGLSPNLSSSGRQGKIQRPMWWLQVFPN